MKFYLSSYKLGEMTDELKRLVPRGNIGYIPNALDFSNANTERRAKHIENEMQSLRDLGLNVQLLNLKDYFGKKDDLREKLDEIGAVFISGGNVFVLRQAMRLSGMDDILKEFEEKDFLYAGYSAAGCVLSPKLDAYEIVDDATDTPYEEQKEVIWEGIGLIDHAFLPHYDSDHSESEEINKEVQYCKDNDIPFKTFKDGEVLIIE